MQNPRNESVPGMVQQEQGRLCVWRRLSEGGIIRNKVREAVAFTLS